MTNREQLVEQARSAAAKAYAPYSRFGVGAAIRLRNGTVVTGANLENASYGLSLCAEAAALARLNSEYDLAEIAEVAITGGRIAKDGMIEGRMPVRPCGRCRQMLNEAAQRAGCDLDVHCASADGLTIETHRLSELLPLAFGPADLD